MSRDARRRLTVKCTPDDSKRVFAVRDSFSIGARSLRVFKWCDLHYSGSSTSTTGGVGSSSSVSPGSTGGSGDQATQTLLKAAMGVAQDLYRQNSNYGQAAPTELEQFSSVVTFVAPDFVVSGSQVSVSNGGDNTNQTVTLAAASSTGTCWYLVDVASSDSETLTAGLGITSAGMWYGHANNSASVCTAPDSGPPAGSSLSGGWSNTGF